MAMFKSFKQATRGETPQFLAAEVAAGNARNQAKAQANALRSQNTLGGASLYNAGTNAAGVSPITDAFSNTFGGGVGNGVANNAAADVAAENASGEILSMPADALVQDAATDTATQAGTDAATQAGTDALADAGANVATDALADAGANVATDALADAGVNAATDAAAQGLAQAGASTAANTAGSSILGMNPYGLAIMAALQLLG